MQAAPTATVTLTHADLARLWCQWNGQRGTTKQIASVMQRTTFDTLARMLSARGVVTVREEQA